MKSQSIAIFCRVYEHYNFLHFPTKYYFPTGQKSPSCIINRCKFFSCACVLGHFLIFTPAIYVYVETICGGSNCLWAYLTHATCKSRSNRNKRCDSLYHIQLDSGTLFHYRKMCECTQIFPMKM